MADKSEQPPSLHTVVPLRDAFVFGSYGDSLHQKFCLSEKFENFYGYDDNYDSITWLARGIVTFPSLCWFASSVTQKTNYTTCLVRRNAIKWPEAVVSESDSHHLMNKAYGDELSNLTVDGLFIFS